MSGFLRWVGFTLVLYVLCAAVFYTANIATIIAIRGLAPLTWDVLMAILIRDALVSIPIAIVFALLAPRLHIRGRR